MQKRFFAAALGLALLPAAAVHADSTVDQTIKGDEAQTFQALVQGPGEPYSVRTELVSANAGREGRRVSLLYFGQISDFQLADEESPARVEFMDSDPSRTASAAWRPGEALVPHQVDQSIRTMNRFLTSPLTQGDGSRAQLLNAVLTGDLADSAQRNETEWVLRLLDGGTLDPNSGTAELAGSSCAPGTPLDDPAKYTGVQDYDDTSQDTFYDPDQPTGAWAAWPQYPGLMDRAQVPFPVEGLKVPSYVAFGNHDSLVQGNEDANEPVEEIATGCVKATDGLPMLVPPDPNRQFVDKAQYKSVFIEGAQEDGHGFDYIDPAELEASAGAAGYYAWSPKPGWRFIGLDTVSEGGVVGVSADGNIDDPQFQWLTKELAAATERNELIVVFGHHGTSSLTAQAPDEAASPCSESDGHGHDRNPGCDRDPRDSSPLHLGEDVANLFLAHPHVVAFVAGHSHNNRVSFYQRSVIADQPAGAEGPSSYSSGFWEIKSPAISDWPPQNRLIEVMENCDGTFSIFGTMLDHDAPLEVPLGGTAADAFDPLTLAAVGRLLTFNDPQQTPEASLGEKTDRNVELLLKDPRAKRPADPKLTLRAKRRARRVTLSARSDGRPVRGAAVRFAGKRKRTNAKGIARFRTRKGGRAVATKTLGCTKRRAVARVRSLK